MKKKPIIIISFLFSIFLIAILTVLCTLAIKTHKNTSGDLHNIKGSSYQSLFLSCYEPEAFPDGIYKKYMGVENLSCSKEITTLQTMGNYLKTAFEKDNELSYVFIVVDPLALWKSSLGSSTLFNVLLDKELLSIIDSHNECNFFIVFAPLSKEFWREQPDKTFGSYIKAVSIMSEQLGNRENVSLNYAQDEEWLISNSGAYTDPYYLTEEAADYLMTLTLGGFLNKSGEDIMMSLSTMKKLKSEDQDSEQYGDLSDYTIVYLGDSIFGNCQNFSSIPNAVEALTGAQGINLGLNGASATHLEKGFPYFQGMVKDFLNRKDQLINSENKLCFVIHFGLNDYFEGCSITEFENGMINGIQTLRMAYPKAAILLLSPYTVTACHNGTELLNGSSFVLKDYQEAIKTLSQEENTLFEDMQKALGWDAETAETYLSDMVHPNNQGNFEFAQALGKYLTKQFRPF